MTTTCLKELSYFGCGGTAVAVHRPHSVDELQACLSQLVAASLPVFFLGGGSNSLISDGIYPGHVVSAASLNTITFEPPNYLRCGAGVSPDAVVSAAIAHGLRGAAWMSGLPGHIGGAVRMNARCYGSEISQLIHTLTTVSLAGEMIEYHGPQSLFYGYKDTYFMQVREFIGEVGLQLDVASAAELRAEVELQQYCQADRRFKGQYLWPSCGCVFKNNYAVGVPSGMLLELAGVKALQHGGAQVSEHHANFIFNRHATSADILELSFQMRELVYQMFGVWLAYEMEFLGEFDPEYRQQIQAIQPYCDDLLFENRRREARDHFKQKSVPRLQQHSAELTAAIKRQICG